MSKSFIRNKRYGEFSNQIKDMEELFTNYKTLSNENQDFFKGFDIEEVKLEDNMNILAEI